MGDLSIVDRILSQVQSSIKAGAKRAHKLDQQTRREDVQTLIDLYSGAQFEILSDDLRTYDTAERAALLQVSQVLNITKWVIDESSLAYASPPVIRVKAGETDLTDTWEALTESGRFGMALREAERYAHLVNDVALMPAYRITEGGPAVCFDLFTPDRYDVVQNPNEPDKPAAIAINFLLQDSDVDAAGTPMASRLVWTRDKLVYMDHDGTMLAPDYLPPRYNGENPYAPMIPVVMVRSTVPLFGEFYGPMATDLGLYNRELNKLLTEIRLLEKMQGFGQLVVINPAEGAKDLIKIGVTKPIIVANKPDMPPGDAKYIAPGAPLSELLEAKNNLLREIAMRYSLNGDDLVAAAAGAPQSGKSKQISNARLKRRTAEFREITRPAVIELVRKTLAVAKYWGQFPEYKLPDVDLSGLPDSMADVTVEVAYPEAAFDSAEEFQLVSDKADKGLTNWAIEYMKQNPEVRTEEDALAAIRENIAINRSLGGGGALDQALQAMNGPDAGMLADMSGADPQPAPKPRKFKLVKAADGTTTGIEEDTAQDIPAPSQQSADAQGAAVSGQVQQTALNGAQVQALQEIALAVSAGEIGAEAGKAMIEAAFPLIDPALVQKIVADAGKRKPKEPPPQRQPEGRPPQ